MATIGLLVIGDELLSGKRQDRHFPKLIELLAARGLELGWARFLPDDEAAIAEAIASANQRGNVVLSCGGIGATPDDCTRQAAARAFNLPLVRHAEAAALIVNQYGEAAHPNRVLMADFPQGARLIPNPVNRVAGFALRQCYFVPGFPEMAWPMLEWVLDHELVSLRTARPAVEFRLRAIGTSGEGDLLPLMSATLSRYPQIRLSSLPFRGGVDRPRHIEFGFKGAPEQAAAAYRYFSSGLKSFADIRIETLAAPEPEA